jgi:hypothetical protein
LIRKIAFGVIGCAIAIYSGDYLVFRIRHEPTSTVTVRRYYAIQQKANRVEYVFNGEQNQTCVKALFPHLGSQPCWYLSRHAEQRIDI